MGEATKEALDGRGGMKGGQGEGRGRTEGMRMITGNFIGQIFMSN